MWNKITNTVVVLALLVIPVATTEAAEQDWSRYLADDVSAFALVRLETNHLPAIASNFDDWDAIAGVDSATATGMVDGIMQQSKVLQSAGIDSIGGIFRFSDLQDGSPSFVFSLKADANPQVAYGVVKMLLVTTPGMQTRLTKNAILVATTDGQLDRLEKPTAPTRDYEEALAKLQGSAGGILVCLDNNSRRVLGSVVEKLPEPFELVTGKMLSEDLDWATFTLGGDSILDFEFYLQGTSEATAQQHQETVATLVQRLAQLTQLDRYMSTQQWESLLGLLLPQQDESALVINGEALKEKREQWQPVFQQALVDYVRFVRQTRDERKLKQILLALHNYESAYQVFPRPDGQSDRNPAGLSWRVHLLPYLGETKLWRKFHMDEPWDSPHNQALIAEMPAVFKSHLNSAAESNQKGKTLFQLPVGEEGIFGMGRDSVGIPGITDGTVNTLLVVRTVPDAAVVWTQPDDWEYDLNTPSEGLVDQGTGYLLLGTADGATYWLDSDNSEGVLKAMITSSRRENVDRSLLLKANDLTPKR